MTTIPDEKLEEYRQFILANPRAEYGAIDMRELANMVDACQLSQDTNAAYAQFYRQRNKDQAEQLRRASIRGHVKLWLGCAGGAIGGIAPDLMGWW